MCGSLHLTRNVLKTLQVSKLIYIVSRVKPCSFNRSKIRRIVSINLTVREPLTTLENIRDTWGLRDKVVPNMTLYGNLILQCCPHIQCRLSIKKSEVKSRQCLVILVIDNPKPILVLDQHVEFTTIEGTIRQLNL